MHQIRAHLAHAGFPLVGNRLPRPAAVRRRPGHFLHAEAPHACRTPPPLAHVRRALPPRPAHLLSTLLGFTAPP